MRQITITAAAVAALLSVSGPASAVLADFDLGRYRIVGSHALPAVSASEASAITYRPSSQTLFVLGDEGDALVEVSRTGQQLSVMTLTGFDDTEGLTFIGESGAGGRFVLTEERLQQSYLLTYVAGGSVDRSALATVDLGLDVGNTGIEGISHDPRDGSFITVKERAPQDVRRNAIDFGAGTATSMNLFDPALLSLSDLSDVQVLAAVPDYAAGAEADNLLVLSQESRRLLEVDRSGNILSMLDLSTLPDSVEGVTLDFAGNVYLVAENGDAPLLFVASPVPLPGALVLMSAAWGLLAMFRRR